MLHTETAQRHTANLPGMAEGPVSASMADPEQGGHGFSNSGTVGNQAASPPPPPPPPAETFITMKGTESGESDVSSISYAEVTYWEITRHFFIMGWIGFGGPAAHIGLFQRVSWVKFSHLTHLKFGMCSCNVFCIRGQYALP